MLDEDAYDYDADHFLLTSVDLPVVAQILDATLEKSYLGIILQLDQRLLSELMVDNNLPSMAPCRTKRIVSRI